MNLNKENEAILIQYLLGELNDEESEQIEENYFADKDLFERLLIVEDELIDDYVSGKLPDERVKRFEEHYLRTPQRRERVETAAALLKYMSNRSTLSATKPKSVKHSVKDYLLYLSIAATILALTGISLLLIERARLIKALDASNADRAALTKDRDELRKKLKEDSLHNQLLSQESERERNRKAEPQDKSLQNEKEAPTASIASFIFMTGVTRGGGAGNKFVIRPGTKQVSLQAIFKSEDYQSYQALLTTIEGEKIYNRTDLKAQNGKTGKAVAFKMPAELLKEQDYFLTIMGDSSTGKPQKVAEYSFRVEKK